MIETEEKTFFTKVEENRFANIFNDLFQKFGKFQEPKVVLNLMFNSNLQRSKVLLYLPKSTTGFRDFS